MATTSDIEGFETDIAGTATDKHLASIEQEILQGADAVLDEYNTPPGAAWTASGTIVAGFE